MNSVEIKLLKDVVKLVTGKTPPTKNEDYFNGGVFWLTPSDFKHKYVSNTERTVSQLAINDKKVNVIKNNSLFVTCIGNIGKVIINKNLCTSNQQITALEIKDESQCLVEYLYYWFIKNQKNIESKSNKAVVPIINNAILGEVEIPLPPLATQKAIAEKLDKADALRKKDQELLKQYDELAQSIFIEMFGDPVQNEKGWEKIQLGNFITTLVDVGSNGANDWVSANIKMKDEEDYAMMIRTTNLSNNDFRDNLKYVTEETYNLFKKTKVFGGEVIMNKIGSAGDFWIMPNLNRPVSLGLNQLMFEFENLNTLFFKHYFSTDYGVKLIKSNLRGAITKSITKTALRELEIYNVPLELQNQFADKIKNIEAQKELVKKQAEESENLFQALLQESFNFK